MLDRIKNTYHEFPLKFWVLVGSAFIDRIGSTVLIPFFALYITQKFNVGMTQAGALLGVFAISGFFGSMFGGALTDKFGRRKMVIFGLVSSALTSVSLGLVDQLYLFYILAFVAGLFSNIAAPARQAMVADMLPEEKRAEGYGTLRVVGNLAWIMGPMIGGLLAATSYLLLFVSDAVTSLITAAIVYKLIPETKPLASAEHAQQSFLKTMIGYRVVMQDKMYMAFLFIATLMTLVYLQMYNTLSVYLRDVHGVPAQGFGFLLSLDAAVVVLFQFWVTRRIKEFAPLVMMAVGSALYMVGFTMYGFVTTYFMFVVAIIIITIGEMIVIPVGQAMVARFAPDDMRGRYMAFYSLSWTLPASVGPLAAGLIMDNYDPNWVWYASGIILAITVVGYYALHLKMKSHKVLQSGKEQKAPAAP